MDKHNKIVTDMVDKEVLTTNLDDVKECISMLGIIPASRNDSKVLRMRNFHNSIVKQKLITGLADFIRFDNPKKDVILLDISVGEGADINRWIYAGIGYVFGFDIKQESIDQLNIRLDENKNKKHIYIETAVGDATKPSDPLKKQIEKFLDFFKKPTRKFNLISCQMAFHYFCENTKTLEKVLNFISDNLEKGGYFFCTTINGDKLLKEFETKKVIDNPLFTINKQSEKKYFIQTKDYPGINYLNNGSLEYFVESKDFIKAAKNVGLELITHDPFKPFHIQDTEKNTIQKPLILYGKTSMFSFDDLYKSTTKEDYIEMTPDELELNKYYIAYVFQKIK
jgi:mRNA (guanine-N7-)-methyltransferase